jgi:hypothetical protein
MIKRGDFFFCDNNCGFTETFDVVQEHEKTCRFKLDAALAAAVESSEKDQYHCDKGCGFTGTFLAVSEHELTCTHTEMPQEDTWEQDSEEFLRIGPPPPPPPKRYDADVGNVYSMPEFEVGPDFTNVGGYWPTTGVEDMTYALYGWGSLSGEGAPVEMRFDSNEDMHDSNWYTGKGDKTKVDTDNKKSKPKAKGKGKSK